MCCTNPSILLHLCSESLIELHTSSSSPPPISFRSHSRHLRPLTILTMSRSLLLSVVVAVLAVLCLSTSTLTRAQHTAAPGCQETFLDLYSIVSVNNLIPNTSNILFNLTTTLGVDNYTITLPTSYQQALIYLQIGVASTAVNATFNVTANGVPVAGTYNGNTSGTFVLAGNFGQLGLISRTNLIVIQFTNNNCTFTDYFYIINPAVTTSSVRGDPQFVGLRGQSFQVHGMDGAVYALISDAHVQVNTRFVFLQGPRPCPVMPSTGKQASTCWSHAGSYLGELAVKTSAGDRVLVVAGSAVDGFSSVIVNDKEIAIESTKNLQHLNNNVPTGSIIYNNTHELTITCSLFTLTVENIDGFLNIRSLAVLDGQWGRLAAHGLLGQTWQWKRYSGKVKEIEGEVDDYAIDGDDLFGERFLFSRFESEPHMQ